MNLAFKTFPYSFNNNILLAFALCMLNSQNTPAQTWLWAKSAKGTSMTLGDEGYGAATDASGNLYVTGGFATPIITFGPYSLTNSGSMDVYLTKYDASGNVLWTRSSGGPGDDRGNSVATDAFGNVYVAGEFSYPTDFFGYSSNGYNDVFLAKYDSSGNLLWVESAGGTFPDRCLAVATDLSGNVYITGGFQSSSITFGPYTLADSGASNIYIAKYDASGNVLWAQSTGGTFNASGTGVATDASGNVYLSGGFSSPTIRFGSYKLTNPGGGDGFLAKYDSSGTVLWAKSIGGPVNEQPFSVVTDTRNCVYVTGEFNSPSIIFDSDTLTNSGDYDAFITKYDASGHVIWAKSAIGTGVDYGYAVATDPSGGVFVAGSFLSPSIIFGSDTLYFPPDGNDPMFIVKYDSAGNVLCASALASGGDDKGGLATDAFGNAYLAQDFFAVNSFKVGADTLVLAGLENVFVAKYSCSSYIPPPTALFTPVGDTVCAGSTVHFTDHSKGTPNRWQWTFGGGIPSFSTLQNPIVTYDTAGTFPVKLVVSNSGGSDSVTKSSSVKVNPLPKPKVNAADTLICSGDSARVCATTGYTKYLWNDNSTTDCIETKSAGGFWVTVTDANGCSAVSAHQNISVYPVPSVSIVVQGDTLASFNAVSYQWYRNGNLLTGSDKGILIADQDGDYAVQVTDSNGCVAISNSVHITLAGINDEQLNSFINLFPNPATGEVFLTISREIDISEIRIFNMMGQEVRRKAIQSSGVGRIKIDVSDLPAGVFELLIYNSRQYVCSKLLVHDEDL